LECIRKWRSSSNYEHKVVKAWLDKRFYLFEIQSILLLSFSPECRTKSDFVTPTKYWPENDPAKNSLIQAYKENLQ